MTSEELTLAKVAAARIPRVVQPRNLPQPVKEPKQKPRTLPALPRAANERELPRFVYHTRKGKFRVSIRRGGVSYRATFNTVEEAEAAAKIANEAAGPSQSALWTQEDDDTIRKLSETHEVGDIAKKLQRTKSAVKTRANIIGVRFGRPEKVLRLYLAQANETIAKLTTALHDAINHPKGVVPVSAEPFYNQNHGR